MTGGGDGAGGKPSATGWYVLRAYLARGTTRIRPGFDLRHALPPLLAAGELPLDSYVLRLMLAEFVGLAAADVIQAAEDLRAEAERLAAADQGRPPWD